MVVVVTMMVMMLLRECGARKEHDDGEQQSLFHGPNDSNNGESWLPLGLLFRVASVPQ
jgi:hypothetical protein